MIDKISIRAFVAATEDEERVREALSIFVPLDRISSDTALGHFGNEIKILEACLKRKEAQDFFQILREQLPAEDCSRLHHEIPDRLEGKSHFHLRLDKQAAYRGLFRLTDSRDSLAVCALVKTYPSNRDLAIKILSELI